MVSWIYTGYLYTNFSKLVHITGYYTKFLKMANNTGYYTNFSKIPNGNTMLCFFIQSSQDNKIYRLFIYNSLKYANNTGFYTKFSNMQTILVFIQCSQICKKYCFCTKFSRITKYTSYFYTKLSKIANHTAYYSNLSKKQNRITRDKVCQLPSQGQWFSHASSTSKTDYCDLTEIC